MARRLFQSKVLQKLWERKIPFFLVFYTILTLSYGLLYALDFYPEPIEDTAEEVTGESAVEPAAPEETIEPETTDTPETVAVPASAEPILIKFDTLDKQVAVLNPESRAVADLDAALLKGVVRHPDSADFTEAGNMFILGHSSYLPNVLNKNFQAFNGIQDLEWGDTITVYSTDRAYTYRVDRVYEALASEVVVPNSRGEAKLTLATCDSFGSKDDRFIVEATLVNEQSR